MEALAQYQSKQPVDSVDPVQNFISLLFWSRDQTHIWHIQTSNKALHKALNNYYEEIITLADRIMEVYLGHFPDKKKTFLPILLGIPYVPLSESSVRDHFVSITQQIDQLRNNVQGYPNIVNVLDDADEFLNKMLYLITLS